MVEPEPFPDRLFEACQEVAHDRTSLVWLQRLPQFEELADDQERTQRLRGSEYVIGDAACLVRLALRDENGNQGKLAECPAPCPMTRAKGDDALSLAANRLISMPLSGTSADAIQQFLAQSNGGSPAVTDKNVKSLIYLVLATPENQLN